MEIKILCPGCPKCTALQKNLEQALSRAGDDVESQRVSDYDQIASYGVRSVPALAIDGDIVIAGTVPNVDELLQLINLADS